MEVDQLPKQGSDSISIEHLVQSNVTDNNSTTDHSISKNEASVGSPNNVGDTPGAISSSKAATQNSGTNELDF